MSVESIDTVVIGGGQAGLAMSEHLRNNQVAHIVLERDRIAERWRSARWDSLVANGPAWHDCFPTFAFDDIEPGAFATKDRVVRYFEDFAKRIQAPIRCGVAVESVKKNIGQTGFHVQTSEGALSANNVVVATGPFQQPVMPALIPASAGLTQIHSATYRAPDQLPEGPVLIVGAGSSGAQIADELLRTGRQVFLSVGPHDRPPRSYRGRDYCWWLGVLGKWDLATPDPDTAHVTISVSGADGGHTVDFRRCAARGMTLLGMTQRYEDGVLYFADDLVDNVARGDANYLSVLKEADEWCVRNGVDMPEEPQAWQIDPDPDCLTHPVKSLDLKATGIQSVVWATGYVQDFSWLDVNAFDAEGKPDHRRGVSGEPGIYFLGLPWLSRRGSSFIWGVWHDAKYLADHITTQHRYLAHHRNPAARL